MVQCFLQLGKIFENAILQDIVVQPKLGSYYKILLLISVSKYYLQGRQNATQSNQSLLSNHQFCMSKNLKISQGINAKVFSITGQSKLSNFHRMHL